MGNNAKDVLAFWEALGPKLAQFVRENTRIAVRKRKMNVSSVDTSAQTVTVYDGSDTTHTITIPYVPLRGIESLTSSQSVLVEWISNDLSTAVAVSPGRGWWGSPIARTTSTPTISIAGTVNTARLDKSGKVVVMTLSVNITAAISANTWTPIGTVNSAANRPAATTTAIAMINSASAIAQIRVQPGGNIQISSNVSISASTNGTPLRAGMTWITA